VRPPLDGQRHRLRPVPENRSGCRPIGEIGNKILARMAAPGPLYAKLALRRFTRYGIRKQAWPFEHFSETASSAIGRSRVNTRFRSSRIRHFAGSRFIQARIAHVLRRKSWRERLYERGCATINEQQVSFLGIDLHRLEQSRHAEDLHDALHVIGQDVERHFCPYIA
jgi:hypothetical protein